MCEDYCTIRVKSWYMNGKYPSLINVNRRPGYVFPLPSIRENISIKIPYSIQLNSTLFPLRTKNT